MLPTSIYIGDKPSPFKLCKTVNYPRASTERDKPLGGLWASTKDVMYGTDWLRLCHTEMGGVCLWHGEGEKLQATTAWIIHPKPSARILHIECEEDYEIVKELYPRDAPGIHRHLDGSITPNTIVDWEAVAKEYDIVYMEAYHIARSWDCETVLYLRWNAVDYVEPEPWVSSKCEELVKKGKQGYGD